MFNWGQVILKCISPQDNWLSNIFLCHYHSLEFYSDMTHKGDLCQIYVILDALREAILLCLKTVKPKYFKELICENVTKLTQFVSCRLCSVKVPLRTSFPQQPLFNVPVGCPYIYFCFIFSTMATSPQQQWPLKHYIITPYIYTSLQWPLLDNSYFALSPMWLFFGRFDCSFDINHTSEVYLITFNCIYNFFSGGNMVRSMWTFSGMKCCTNRFK